MDRRLFLKSASLAAAGAGLGHLPGVAWTQAAGSSDLSGYRALVCVFLFGGNDSLNLLVPRSGAAYAEYQQSRQNLAIAADQLLPITPAIGDGNQYGLHPAVGGLQSLFESGNAAFVANVGPLVQPVTRAQYLAGSATLPPQLFSHNDQQDQWHTLKGRTLSKTGWAGRIADQVQPALAAQRLPLNVSLRGTIVFQAGASTVPYTLGTNGAPELTGINNANALSAMRKSAFESLLAQSHPSIFARSFATVQQRAISTAGVVNAALAGAPAITTAFPASGLGAQLAMVARMIAVRAELGMSRQVFFVSTGGFDTHDDQVADQPALLGDVSDSLKAFYDATVELGVSDRVVSFTQSDFGRTLTSNGDGTDHGWGGHQVVVGDLAGGRQIHGQFPRLAINGPDDTTGGRLIPTTSADQYAATLARWFGLSDAQVDAVAPSFVNFGRQYLPIV